MPRQPLQKIMPDYQTFFFLFWKWCGFPLTPSFFFSIEINFAVFAAVMPELIQTASFSVWIPYAVFIDLTKR